jgi:hypothetical protein
MVSASGKSGVSRRRARSAPIVGKGAKTTPALQIAEQSGLLSGPRRGI